LDKPLDLLGIHGHWAAFRVEIAPTHLRHHKLRRSPAATPHLSSQPAIPEPPARIVPLVGPSMSQLAIPAPDPSNPRGTPPGPRIGTPKSRPQRSQNVTARGSRQPTLMRASQLGQPQGGLASER